MRNAVFNLGIITMVTALCGCSLLTDNKQAAVDLSTPETTVVSFTKAAACGDSETALACCLPGGLDYDDVRKCLATSPDDEFKRMLESIDLDAPMSVISKKKEEDKVVVVWRVTFKRDFRTMEGGGQTFKVGSTFDLDASLKKSEDQWLIDGI